MQTALRGSSGLKRESRREREDNSGCYAGV
jgi:hypothetical protein